MQVLYLVGFSIKGNSGKNKATREKAKHLKNKLGSNNFTFISNEFNSKSVLGKIGDKIRFDIFSFQQVLKMDKGFVYIRRASGMPFTYLGLCLKNAIIVSEFHADFKEEIPHLQKSRFEKIILNLYVPIYNMTYKFSNAIIYNHPILKDKYDLIYKKPSIFSYNGANVHDFLPENINAARNKLALELDKKIYLFLGSVSKWHGVNYLVEIFNQKTLLNQKDHYLYIVGAGNTDYVQSLKDSVINENIIFIEPVPTEIAKDYINASNFCLLPANDIRISPGSPLKLYDYISCGKPVISQSNLLGYSDEVENYNLGYTVDFTNASLAASKLLKISKSSKDFKESNRKIAETELSWSNRMDKWVEFCKSLI